MSRAPGAAAPCVFLRSHGYLAGAKLEPLDLAGWGLGELGDELDPPRILVRCKAVLHEGFELVWGRARIRLENDESLWLDEPVGIGRTDDRSLEDCRMRAECTFDLER